MGYYYANDEEHAKMKCVTCQKEIGKGRPFYFVTVQPETIQHIACAE